MRRKILIKTIDAEDITTVEEGQYSVTFNLDPSNLNQVEAFAIGGNGGGGGGNTIVNLIDYNYSITKNVFQSIKNTLSELKGTYGLLIMSIYEENTLYCVRNGSPLLVGQNEDMVIITSEQSGFNGQVASYITLHNDDICIIRNNVNLLYRWSNQVLWACNSSAKN